MTRSRWQKVKDLVTFPLRAITLFEEDRWGLSSLRSERFDYCASQVQGYCLDVGCGRNNLFIRDYLDGGGKGIDVFPYEGLGKENLVEDISKFPFEDCAFDSVTFIANINHIPKSKRDVELIEAYRCLKRGGNIIVTMGVPFAELMVHRIVALYDKINGTKHDMDNERGMDEDEAYYLTDKEIITRLSHAFFQDITKKRFLTQWGLNAMFIGWKQS
jgi:SAM-dependent methyltransferase